MAAKYIAFLGPFTNDLTALQTKLVDVEEGGLQGFRPDLPGFQAMSHSLADAMPLHGATAGIPQEIYDHFVMCNETVDQIDEHLAVAAKHLEVLRESRAFYVDARQNDISLMVDAIRSRAQRRKDSSLLVPFEKVIKYAGQIGDKAAQTRKKNEQAKAEAEAQAQPQPGAATPPPPPEGQTPPSTPTPA